MQQELLDVSQTYNTKLNNGTLTDIDKIEYVKFLDTVAALSSKEAGVVAEAGRGLRALREMAKTPDELLHQIDKLVNHIKKRCYWF